MSLRPRTDLSVSDDTAHVARAIFHEENLVMQMRDLLPATHIADTGFVNAPLLAEAREGYNIDLIGPTRGDNQWQLKEGAGFAARDFDIDWDRNHAVCPEGKISSSWTPAVDRRKNEVIEFSGADCGVCPSLARCTRSIASAEDDHHPASRRARGAPSGATTRADSRVRRRVRAAGRGRADHRAGDPLAWASAVALRRARQDAPPAPDDGGSDERGATAGMAGGRGESCEGPLAFARLYLAPSTV